MFTTIGIELTYTARFCVEFYANTGKDASRSDIHYLMSTALRDKLNEKNIAVAKCTTDPGCVEVPTLPFKSLPKLMANIRAIEKQARDIMLIPQPGYYCGGGAHIHAGIPNAKGKPIVEDNRSYWMLDAKEKAAHNAQDKHILNYAKRAQVIAAQNPWLCWAFSGPNDTYNANPLKASHIMPAVDTLEELLEQYTAKRQSILNMQKTLHTVKGWANDRAYRINWLNNNARMLAKLRGQIAKARKAGKLVNYEDIRCREEKDVTCVFRSVLNTMEFRAFLMPHNPAGHKAHIAIVQAVMQQAYLNLAHSAVDPATLYDGKPMSYRIAKAGFLSMLAGFGLDPSAYRADLYRMALRARYMRNRGGLT